MTQTVLLGDLAEKIAMGPFGSNIKVSTFVEAGVPIISGQHLKGVTVDDREGYNFISTEHADKLRNSNVFRGDVVFTHAGNIGQVAYIPQNSKYDRYVLSQRQFYLRPLKNLSAEYLTYYFKSPKGQSQLFEFANQTGVPSLSQPATNLKKIKVELPELEVQEKIADILGTIDEKIELNRKMNTTLDQMGQTLFRHYIIDNPEAGKWEVKSLDEIADFLNGLAMQKYPRVDGEPTLPVVKIREMSSGITANTDIASANIPEQYIVHNGDLLFSWSGTLLVKFWAEGRGALNQHLFKVTSKEYPEWLYYYWTKYHLNDFIQTAKAKATTMGHIQRKHLKQAMVRVPNTTALEGIGGKIQPLIDAGKENANQIQTLIDLRDSLLPKLISGAIKP